MKKALTLFVSLAMLATFATFVSGCSGGSEGADIPQGVQDEMKNLGDAARKAEGNFDNLGDADKQKFLERVNGDEASARRMVGQMGGAGGPRGAGSK